MTQLKFLNQTLELVQQVAGRLHQVKCIVIAEITLIVADVVTSQDMKTKTLFMVYALIYGRIFFIVSAITLTISTHKFLHYCNMVDNLFVPMTSSNFGSTHRLLKQRQRLDTAFRVAYLVTFLAICAPCYGGEINKIFPWLNYIKKHYNIMYYEALAIQIFNLQVLAIVTQALLQASIITISNLIVQADVFAQEIKCNKILNVKGFFVKFDGSYQRKVSKELVEIYKKHLKFLKYIDEYRGCPHVRSVGLIILYGGLGVVSFTAACFLLLNSES
ncbi:hypothetical protein GWI33_005441 [Rhynchophorus ferrugineus]|uniref:Uncharacterized protein n=1 Tax=Rhynchophorus ferrugineus TaxID=354439 RepID=A0A834IHG4_RHYFE|nr:hypothetical protein GWI33_005441 [Rhynchophorus ferrugineus]